MRRAEERSKPLCRNKKRESLNKSTDRDVRGFRSERVTNVFDKYFANQFQPREVMCKSKAGGISINEDLIEEKCKCHFEERMIQKDINCVIHRVNTGKQVNHSERSGR